MRIVIPKSATSSMPALAPVVSERFNTFCAAAGTALKVLVCLSFCLGLSTGFAANLLTNPGFESGQTGWSGAVRGSIAQVVTNAAVAHSGNNYISNYNAGGWSSASQGDTRGGWSTGVAIPVSDQKFYRLSAYVKVPGASTAPQDITLRYRFEPSGNRVDVGQQSISTEDWVLLQSNWIAPAAGDNYISYWEVHSVANAVVFYADDCALEESDGCTISGFVKDNSANAVVGATVQLIQGGTVLKTTTSIAGGAYTFGVTPLAGQIYELNATKLNYSSPAANVSVTTVAPPAVATAGDIVLTALPTVVVSGIVTNSTGGAPIADATVTVLGASGSQSTKTGADGKYSFTIAKDYNYIVTARKLPLAAPAQNIFPTADQVVDFAMSSAVQVGVYAEPLASGSLASWNNAGTLGGQFVPLKSAPVATQVGLYKAVNFNDNPMILTNAALGTYVGAPAEITGAQASFTVSAWLLEPDPTLPDQQTYISWSKRGGPDGSNCEMVYGTNPTFGAAGHWGAPDLGWGTPPTGGTWHNVIVTWDYMTGIESDYIDGVLSKSSPVKTLDIAAGLPIILGSGYWWNSTTSALDGTDIPFSGAIAQVEIFGAPATSDDVTRLAAAGPVAHPTATIQGKVVTSDASAPSGFDITVTDGSGSVQARAVTAAAGTYSVVVPPGTFTVKAIKAGFVTMPAPQTRTVAVGDTATVGDFTATPSTISGTLVNATTGAAIYNGVIQVGGKGGQALVTPQSGVYTLPATGCGGFELFADGLGFRCRNFMFTNVGNLSFKIALTPEVETGVITNGGFEDVASGLPTSWIQGWDPTAPAPVTEFWATNVPYSGANSAFVTQIGAAAYEPLAQFIPSDPAAVYNCYCKAVGTNMTSAGTVWFPMFAFRDSTFGEMKGWISGEPAPYEGWSHTAPTNWMQYLLFHTYAGDATQPFVRIAPPAGAVWLSASFCFSGSALTSDQGVFVDDVVMDKVPANVPLEYVAPDAGVTLTVQKIGTSIKLTWSEGTLLESSSLGGTWTTNNASSPYTNTSPTGNKFYKVIVR